MKKKIAILTSGGDAPGMNTAIYEITKYAKKKQIDIYGVCKGYLGLYNNKIYKLNSNKIKHYENKGGTFLKSARFEDFKKKEIQIIAANNLKLKNINTLIIIGGDGSYKGAEKLSQLGIRCICLPGTIDNNIEGTEYTIGFFTALNTIYEAVEKIKDTAYSHQRVFFIEIMGNTGKDLTIYAGIGVGCDLFIIEKFNYQNLKKQIINTLNSQKEDMIILIKENICDINELVCNLKKDTKKDIKTIILGHIQRGGSPNVLDAILARRMAYYAINIYFKNNLNYKIGIKNNKIINY